MKRFILLMGFSIILTIIFIFIFSLILNFSNVSERNSKQVLIGINSFSIMLASFFLSKSFKQRGFALGTIFGLIYMLGLYITSCLITKTFLLNSFGIIMILLGIFCGGIGGILGVNF